MHVRQRRAGSSSATAVCTMRACGPSMRGRTPMRDLVAHGVAVGTLMGSPDALSIPA